MQGPLPIKIFPEERLPLHLQERLQGLVVISTLSDGRCGQASLAYADYKATTIEGVEDVRDTVILEMDNNPRLKTYLDDFFNREADDIDDEGIISSREMLLDALQRDNCYITPHFFLAYACAFRVSVVVHQFAGENIETFNPLGATPLYTIQVILDNTSMDSEHWHYYAVREKLPGATSVDQEILDKAKQKRKRSKARAIGEAVEEKSEPSYLPKEAPVMSKDPLKRKSSNKMPDTTTNMAKSQAAFGQGINSTNAPHIPTLLRDDQKGSIFDALTVLSDPNVIKMLHELSQIAASKPNGDGESKQGEEKDVNAQQQMSNSKDGKRTEMESGRTIDVPLLKGQGIVSCTIVDDTKISDDYCASEIVACTWNQSGGDAEEVLQLFRSRTNNAVLAAWVKWSGDIKKTAAGKTFYRQWMAYPQWTRGSEGQSPEKKR